jgi:hypothetical protein
MTVRERFHATMRADPAVDCCPVIEWATWWDKTIEIWESEELPRGLDQQGLFKHYGLDRFYQFWLATRAPGCPEPLNHGAGLISDEFGYKSLKPLLFPKDSVERALPRIEEALSLSQEGEVIIWYTLDGFFWFPRTLLGIEPHLYAFYDKPDLYHRICEDLLEWQFDAVEKLSRYIKADFMTFAEDMSYNNGPMISEETFETFIAPYYRQITPIIKGGGTRVIVDSDGDIARCVPWFIRCGAEGILPLEKQAGVDIANLQVQYPEFLFLGGFDKMCLLRGKDAIDAEFQRILPILRKGRYIPSVDHQTPPGVTMENYIYYVSQLRKFSAQACKDSAVIM